MLHQHRADFGLEEGEAILCRQSWKHYGKPRCKRDDKPGGLACD
jgi:hypothetical protein